MRRTEIRLAASAWELGELGETMAAKARTKGNAWRISVGAAEGSSAD